MREPVAASREKGFQGHSVKLGASPAEGGPAPDAARIPASLAVDEASLLRLIEDDAAEGIGLKISKHGGLTRRRRQRDLCLAAGPTISVRETAGSEIAFAAIAHLGPTVPPHMLRCMPDLRDLCTTVTARFDAPIDDGGVRVPNAPGLGLDVDRDILGEPVARFG